jgi:hypothetical protein
MKKTLITLVAFLITLNFATAQITLEADYEHSGAFTQLSNSGWKFFLMDVTANQCRIYNTDNSLWKTINLSVPTGHYLYDVKYVSENLFTNDNSLSLLYIYYFYDEVYQYYTYTLKIIKEDGTVLKTVENAQYAFANNIGEAGTKLTVYAYDYSFYPYSILTLVYDLPGELMSSNDDLGNSFNVQNAFPNPSTDYSVIPYELPQGVNEGEIQLMNMQGKLIRSFRIDHQFENLQINTSQYPHGTYLYQISAGEYKSGAKKLIIN